MDADKSKSRLLFLVLAFFLAFAFSFIVSTAYAQGPPGLGGGDDVNDEAPISSLVLLGLAAGAVFGVKKLK